MIYLKVWGCSTVGLSNSNFFCANTKKTQEKFAFYENSVVSL